MKSELAAPEAEEEKEKMIVSKLDKWTAWTLLAEAWGIISNAGEGLWENESKEWQGAAKKWRDLYFEFAREQVKLYEQEYEQEGKAAPPGPVDGPDGFAG